MTKAYKGMGMEGFVAKWYASTTHKAMDDFRSLAKETAAGLARGSSVLEIAPGPGYFAIELARRGDFRIVGVDISKTFVEIATKNAAEAKVRVEFRQGNASALPFGDAMFDFTLCRAAFKNFSEPVKAIEEMYRVLKPGGRSVIIDLRKEASTKEIDDYVDGLKASALSSWMTKLTFRKMLLKRAYTRPQFEEMIAKTSFKRGQIVESGMGFEITLTK